MYTHKTRVLAALRGELVDRLPYVPRLDLWYLANATAGTLPKQYVGVPMNDIARAEGWAFHHRFCDDQLDPAFQPLYLHRGINVFYSRDTVFDVVLPKDVEVKVHRTGARTRVEYHTPLGMVSTTTHYDVDSQRHGITIPALVEHLIKTPADYAAAGYLFEHMDVVPNFERFRALGGRRDGRQRRARVHRLVRRVAVPLDPARSLGRDAVLHPLQGSSERDACSCRTHRAAAGQDAEDPVRVAGRCRLVGRELRRHADVPALLRGGDPALDPQGGRGARRGRQAGALPHRRREPGPHGSHPRFGHAHRGVLLSCADDQGHARRVLPALERPAHAVRRHTRPRS